MIGRIHGVLVAKQAPELLVDVQGVGYEILAPMTTIYQLPALGNAVTLHTHFVVREDAQQLFGFADLRERSLFRQLIKVSGVGPKLALAILSGIESDDFVRCIRDDNVAALVSLPGVGKKTAERLLVEMKDRLRDWQSDVTLTETGISVTLPGGSREMIADAESALVALGYKPQEASRAIASVSLDAVTQSEELIRAALKSMVKN